MNPNYTEPARKTKVSKLVPISDIKRNSKFNLRMELNQECITEWAERLEREPDFVMDEVVLYELKGKLYLVDGNHRYEAHLMANRTEIPAEVRTGCTGEEALAFAIEANQRQGNRLTMADRRKCIEHIYNHTDPRWSKMEVERLTGITRKTVALWFAKLDSMEPDDKGKRHFSDYFLQYGQDPPAGEPAPHTVLLDGKSEEDEPAPKSKRGPGRPKKPKPAVAILQELHSVVSRANRDKDWNQIIQLLYNITNRIDEEKTALSYVPEEDEPAEECSDETEPAPKRLIPRDGDIIHTNRDSEEDLESEDSSDLEQDEPDDSSELESVYEDEE